MIAKGRKMSKEQDIDGQNIFQLKRCRRKRKEKPTGFS